MSKKIKMVMMILSLAPLSNLAGAKADNLRLVNRCSYNVEAETNKRLYLRILPEFHYPWGVCLEGSPYLSDTERERIRVAVRIWNVEYRNYKINRWRSANVVNIPDGPLFVESCSGYKYNLIFFGRYNLIEGRLGEYQTIVRDNEPFFGFVSIDTYLPNGNERVWSREQFINTVLHELGHALGIPHLRPEKTQIMASHGFGDGCKENGKMQICKLLPVDFERFLAPYGPEGAYVWEPPSAPIIDCGYYPTRLGGPKMLHRSCW